MADIFDRIAADVAYMSDAEAGLYLRLFLFLKRSNIGTELISDMARRLGKTEADIRPVLSEYFELWPNVPVPEWACLRGDEK